MAKSYLDQDRFCPDYIITLRVSGMSGDEVDTCRLVFENMLRVAEVYSNINKKEVFFKTILNEQMHLMDRAAEDATIAYR